MSAAPLILIVEDEADLRRVIERNLREEGFRAAQAATGGEALRAAASLPPSLVLLDVGLPDLSGLDVCRRLKAGPATRAIPVVMLSARASEGDRVDAYEAGADDYITKPFSLRELILRLSAVLRRGATPEPGELLVAGPIEIDRPRMLVRVDGREVTLTRSELKLLIFLVEAGGRVRAREELARQLVARGRVDPRTVDTHIKRLRTKLDGAADLIETVRAVGYRLRGA